MGFIKSFKDEVKFLFSGKGMPYEKVCLTVAMIISVVFNAAAYEFLNYDLVVMGTRGFGGLDEENLGAVAKFVQENCSKPVIFAKGMPSDREKKIILSAAGTLGKKSPT